MDECIVKISKPSNRLHVSLCPCIPVRSKWVFWKTPSPLGKKFVSQLYMTSCAEQVIITISAPNNREYLLGVNHAILLTTCASTLYHGRAIHSTRASVFKYNLTISVLLRCTSLYCAAASRRNLSPQYQTHPATKLYSHRGRLSTRVAEWAEALSWCAGTGPEGSGWEAVASYRVQPRRPSWLPRLVPRLRIRGFRSSFAALTYLQL